LATQRHANNVKITKSTIAPKRTNAHVKVVKRATLWAHNYKTTNGCTIAIKSTNQLINDEFQMQGSIVMKDELLSTEHYSYKKIQLVPHSLGKHQPRTKNKMNCSDRPKNAILYPSPKFTLK
jgi:hypothetical protein